ncbi:uncharacterized protein LOC100570902 isoform X2 [Acyrthosiphon pisum]|uniref:Uncharacterized protein n=1 Tax=Acyrthosiphon pisum TaxID=7029 RepID=A0A8R2H7W0_ACYPI|nr:uncharacterized protein LOC100570902 isoform X2 [Acyrthosiphon pisum]|eukprot:XP_016664020.1 PREDICTED: uncharacterized protein LOC100570902 isoform X2 [Acyrthosiphon pisum]
METVHEAASKRPLDEDDNDGDDKKKQKTGPDLHQFLPTVENVKTEKDEKKWNLLPSIVFELLALFKNSEKVHSDEDKQDKIDNGIKEDFQVLSNQNCQEKIVDNAFKHENMKEVDRFDKIIIENSNLQVFSTINDSIQDLNKLDFSEKYTTENVPKKVPLFTKASPVKLFAENADVDKTKHTEDESNEKTSVVKKQLTSIHNVCNLSVSMKNVHCTVSSTNYTSKVVVSTENVSNAATSVVCNSIYNTPMLTSHIGIPNTAMLSSTNSISNTAMLSSTNNNTLIVSDNSTHKDVISKTENIFRAQMLEFLNKNCLNDISGVPLTKPYPCICNCCTVVNRIPIKQSAVYNLFFASNDNLNHPNLHCDMNSSNMQVTDCSISATNYRNVNKSNTLINTESPKNIWINELTSLIIKNENTYKRNTVTDANASKKLNPMQNVLNKVHKATKHIKSHFSLCYKCKKSKYSQSHGCKCYSKTYKHKHDKYYLLR